MFFYDPLMNTERLSAKQKFKEAQRWLHYIFDPTNTSTFKVPQRFWGTKMFFEITSEEYQTETLPEFYPYWPAAVTLKRPRTCPRRSAPC